MRKNFKINGFTLIEIMVVVVIIAILAAIVVPKIMNRPEQARQVKARADLMAIQNALDLYKLDNGVYPEMENGLAALIGGYLKEIPKDPWGHAYHYLSPGKHEDVDLWSDGSNNHQITNWEINRG